MKKLVAIAAAVAAIAPFAARAESTLTVNPGTGTTTATAHLDFTINVPKMLFLQIGTGTSYATNATVSNIIFTVPPGANGDGTPITGTGGDLANGSVTVRVVSNTGTVSLVNTVSGPLSSGVPGAPTVPWSDITVTSAALATTTTGFDNGPITHQAFYSGVGSGNSAALSLTPTSGLVRKEGSWTFKYANSTALPAGTYGTSTNNGRVTYTAAAA